MKPNLFLLFSMLRFLIILHKFPLFFASVQILAVVIVFKSFTFVKFLSCFKMPRNIFLSSLFSLLQLIFIFRLLTTHLKQRCSHHYIYIYIYICMYMLSLYIYIYMYMLYIIMVCDILLLTFFLLFSFIL